MLEEVTTWDNTKEIFIGLLEARKDSKEVDFPLVCMDYCIEQRFRVHTLTPKNLFQLHVSNHYASLTGEEGEISNLC